MIRLDLGGTNNENEDEIIKFKLSYDPMDINLQLPNQITTLPTQLRFESLLSIINQNENGLKKRDYTLPLISICICMKNAENFINETLFSVISQTYNGPIELSIFDHSSTDKSIELIRKWLGLFKIFSIGFLLNSDTLKESIKIYNKEYQLILKDFKEENRIDRSQKGGFGVGYSRNQSIIQSHGEYFCLLDSDDIMYCERIEMQLEESLKIPNSIVGSNFIRIPEGSSHRYSQWCNSLSNQQLIYHQFREIPIIQPTWFMKRHIYNRINGYEESFPSGHPNNNQYIYELGSNNNTNVYSHKNQEKHIQIEKEKKEKLLLSLSTAKPPHIPEDLIFFHKHLDQKDSTLSKVHQPLILYRYHDNNQSNLIHRLILLKVRLQFLESRVLSQWPEFSIWGAGRDGKKFFTMLSDANKAKVKSFCDVDEKKLGQTYNAAYTPYKIPIIHFSKVKPPLIICVALDRSNGEFEKNLNSLNLKESIDFYHFN